MGKSLGILIEIKLRETEDLLTQPLDMPSCIIRHTQKILNVISAAMEGNAIFQVNYRDNYQNGRFIFDIHARCTEANDNYKKIPELVFMFLERSIRLREAHITARDKSEIECVTPRELSADHLMKINAELNKIAKKIVALRKKISVKIQRIDGQPAPNQMALLPNLGDLYSSEEPKLPLMPPPPVGEQIETHQLKVSAKLSKNPGELLDLGINITSQSLKVSSTPETLNKLARLMNTLLSQLELTAKINMAPDKNGFHKIIGITDEREETADTENTATS